MTGARLTLLSICIAFGLISIAWAQSTQSTTFVGADGTQKTLSYDETTGQWSGGSNDGSGSKQGMQQLAQMGLQALTSLLGGAGGGPHPVCVAWMQMPKRPPPPPCATPSPNGAVMGICQTSTLCLGKSAPGLDGSMSSVGQQLSQLIQQIMGQGAGGSGNDAGAGFDVYPACTTNPASGTIQNVPCTDSTGALIFDAGQGIASVDTQSFLSDTGVVSSGIADTLSGLVFGGNSSATAQLFGLANRAVSASDALEALVRAPQAAPETPAPAPTFSNAQYASSQAEQGSIVVNDGSVGLVASKRTFNTVTAGFVGASGSGDSSQTLVGRACGASQWGVISFVFGSFFGDLCKSHGF